MVLMDKGDSIFFFRTIQFDWFCQEGDAFHDAVMLLLKDILNSPKEKARFRTNDRGPHLPFIIGHHCQYVLVGPSFSSSNLYLILP